MCPGGGAKASATAGLGDFPGVGVSSQVPQGVRGCLPPAQRVPQLHILRILYKGTHVARSWGWRRGCCAACVSTSKLTPEASEAALEDRVSHMGCQSMLPGGVPSRFAEGSLSQGSYSSSIKVLSVFTGDSFDTEAVVHRDD